MIVFASNQEHHSNLLPWRELPQAQVILIPDKEDGTIDIECLQGQLNSFCKQNDELGDSDKVLLIGCFPAASNITGLLNDDLTITAILHQNGALAFWDYATAAPHTYIDVNPKVTGDVDGLCKKDAVYFSCHKFVGGVQTPGILIAKKRLFSNPKPDGGGGGSVFFVTEDNHRYLKETELREEGGTPAIVESIRAGLVMQLKHSVGIDYITQRDHELMIQAKEKLSSVQNFRLLGNGFINGKHHNLPILSFLIKAPSESKNGNGYLHHNYVSALLNDMFGIQSRGGCACAGPYAQSLLGMPKELANQYESMLMEDERLDRVHLRRGHAEHSQFEVLRPGFTRVNLSWFSSDKEVNFVLDAIAFVAEHGWKMMPQYIFNNETGEWRHHSNQVFHQRRWLGNISYADGSFKYVSRVKENKFDEVQDEKFDVSFAEVMEKANQLISEAPKAAQKLQVPNQRILFQGQAAILRWMVLPIEAKEALISKSTSSFDEVIAPFTPRMFKDEESMPENQNPKIRIEQSEFGVGSLLSKTSLTVAQKFLTPLANRVNLSNPVRLHSDKNRKINWNPDIQTNKEDNREVSFTSSNSKNIQSSLSKSVTKVDTCKNGNCVLLDGSRSSYENIEPLLPRSKCRWHPPTKDIFKPFLEAIEEFGMIKNGDRVLVCLSGGKDSLSLLHTLRQYQFYASKNSKNPIKFDLGGLTIDPQSSSYDPRPLIPYLAELGVPYLYEEQAIMKQGEIF